MDFQLNEDQAALVAAVQAIVEEHQEIPQSHRLGFHYFNETLQNILDENGFLDAAREMSPLEAALVAIEVARAPVVAEVATSALVAPHVVPGARPRGPIAIVDGARIDAAHRNLAVARTALIIDGADVLVHPVRTEEVEPVKTIYAYPFGRFVRRPDLGAAERIRGAAATLEQWARVALAAEYAGAAQAAVSFTVEYVKERKVFKRPVGSFQSVQHRLVQCHQIAQGVYYLALRAAWSGTAYDAAVAACYAQQNTKKLLADLHQFHGGMGVTNEHLLHFWTYRLRALQTEAGGVYGAAREVSCQLWEDAGGGAMSNRELEGVRR